MKTKAQKTQNSKNKLQIIPTKQRSDNQKEFFQDALDLVNDESCGDVIGYAIVAIYKDGYNCRMLNAPDVPELLMPVYAERLLQDHLADLSEEDA